MQFPFLGHPVAPCWSAQQALGGPVHHQGGVLSHRIGNGGLVCRQQLLHLLPGDGQFAGEANLLTGQRHICDRKSDDTGA